MESVKKSILQYQKRWSKLNQYNFWEKLDRSFNLGFLSVIFLSMCSIFLNVSFSNQSKTILITGLLLLGLTILMTTIIVPITLLVIKIVRSFLLWKSFLNYEDEVYKDDYLPFELLFEFLGKNSFLKISWSRLVVEHQFSISWKLLHQSISFCPIKVKIRWMWMWISSEKSYPKINPDFKRVSNAQEYWERLLGQENIFNASFLIEKEQLQEKLPNASISNEFKEKLKPKNRL